MHIAPDFRLDAEYGVVVRDTASQRDIAIHDDGSGVFFRDLVHQPLTDSGVGLSRVGRVGEPLVAIGNQRKGIGQFVVR